MSKKLSLAALSFAALLGAQTGVEGNWQGTLNAGAVKLRIGLHVSKTDAGELTSKLDSIDQGVMGIPVKATTFAANKLHLDMPALHASFEGTLSSDGKEIAGTFTQGAALPLVFKRVEKIETLDRPQTPKPPFPYDAQDVSYEPAPGIKLAGMLTLPRSGGPFPAVLLITGSGPQDRDETLFGHKPFLVIADYLTRRGIAVLRVDDRGVGGSTGSSVQETLDEMVSDVLAGVAYLKGRKEVDPKQIGLIGHSEGAIVGPSAAVRSTDVAFVVMLAGTGVSGQEVLKAQGEAITRASGGSDADVAREHAMQEMIFRVLRTEKDNKAAVEKMKSEWAAMKAKLPSDQAAQREPEDVIDAQFQRVTLPELRSFIFFNPAEVLDKLKTPVLALNGSRDLQVIPSQNLPAITAALVKAGNTDFTVSELPGLNHLFQKCNHCTVDEYGKLDETFSPVALEIVGDWLTRHTHR